MIKCGKCGKLYDYDRYYGICPNCARYNRKDSSAEADRRLHEQYDTTPWAHTAERSHRETHRVNRDPYRHKKDEYEAAHGTYTGQFGRRERNAASGRKSPTGREKGKKNAWPKALAAVIVIFAVFTIFGSVIGIGGLRESPGSSEPTHSFSQVLENAGFEVGGEREPEGVYVEGAYSTRIGEDLSDTDWQGMVTVTPEEISALQAEGLEEGETYYLISVCLKNNSGDVCHLSEPEIRFWTEEGEDVPCRKVFESLYPDVEAGDYGYVDCLVSAPDSETGLEGEYSLDGEPNSFTVDLFPEN